MARIEVAVAVGISATPGLTRYLSQPRACWLWSVPPRRSAPPHDAAARRVALAHFSGRSRPMPAAADRDFEIDIDLVHRRATYRPFANDRTTRANARQRHTYLPIRTASGCRNPDLRLASQGCFFWSPSVVDTTNTAGDRLVAYFVSQHLEQILANRPHTRRLSRCTSTDGRYLLLDSLAS